MIPIQTVEDITSTVWERVAAVYAGGTFGTT